MLECVKTLMDQLENITFQEYYRDYVISVQDANIESEFAYLLSTNDLTPMRVCKLADKSMERLVNYFDRSK